jgi:hypothetical protein
MAARAIAPQRQGTPHQLQERAQRILNRQVVSLVAAELPFVVRRLLLMSLLLIDDQGELWDGQSRRLRTAFDSPYSGGEFIAYAVANLGFVAINIYGASCQVRLRPAFVADATHASLNQWLDLSRNERVVLTWLDGDWKDELLRPPQMVKKRLDDLITAGRGVKPEDYLSRKLRTDELHPASPIGQIVRDWPRFAIPSGQQALMTLLQATLGDRFIVVKQERQRNRLVFHEFGDGLFPHYDTWKTCAVGAPMEELPDRRYGKWAAKGYYETLAGKEPHIEEVDAIVNWPHAGRARLRYKRLIVPICDASGPPMLLGGSILDNRVDLRIGLG